MSDEVIPIAYVRDSDCAQPVAMSRRRFSAPFQGDKQLYVHEQDFFQDADEFESLEISTPDSPDYDSSFLIEETAPIPVTGMPGIVQWTRIYSRIPAQRHEGESYAWQMPGISTTDEFEFINIDNANSSNITGARTRIRVDASSNGGRHDLSVGNFVIINFTGRFGDVYKSLSVYRVVRSISGATQFEVDIVVEGQDPTYSSFQRVDGGRDPITKVVHSILQYDYFLPGISGQPKSLQAITILQPAKIIDGTGKEATSYSTTTTPTKASYMAEVAEGRMIVPEASTVRRWRGNIFERITRFVRAQ